MSGDRATTLFVVQRTGVHCAHAAKQLAGLVLASWCCLGLATSQAQEFDDEFRAGLIGTYSDAAGAQFERLDLRVSLGGGDAIADPRLGDGPLQADWRGYLLSQAPGEYRLYAQVAGQLQIKLNSVVVLDARATQPSWHTSGPLELPYDFHALEVSYRAPGEDPRLALFWSGPQFQLEPIGPRQFYHDPEQTPDDRFQQGRLLARALRCAACHELPGHPPPMPAPSLEYLAGNLNRTWLVDWLAGEAQRPAQSPAESGRRMPHFALDRADAEAIADYLFDQSLSTDWNPPREPAKDRRRKDEKKVDPVSAGEELLLSVGCLACHRLGELGSTGLFDGGELTNVAGKRPAEFFERWLAAPQRINARHRMPVFELTGQERMQLAALLATLGPKQQSVRRDEPRIARGKELVQQHRCAACHQLADRSLPPPAARLPLNRVTERHGGCLERPDASRRRPGYQLAAEQRGVLERFLEAQIQSSGERIAATLLITELNCLACHARDQSAGLATLLTGLAAVRHDLAPQVPAMTPPSLDSVGDKLHRQSLVEAIQRKGQPHRDYLRVRMPSFNLSAEQLATLVEHFIHVDRIPDSGLGGEDQPSTVDGVVLRAVGKRLVTTDGFGCTSCHQIGTVKPTNAPVNARGPDLSMMGERIRRSWFDRFVQNPARIIPRMEMPSVRVPVGGVLGDRLGEQLSAVWDVLNEPGFEPPQPDPVRVLRRTGIAEHRQRPVVVTDVVRTADRSFVKPLLIGLPNRHNVLFDFETASLARWSIGDTARQRTEGKTWYWEAAGNEIFRSALDRAELELEIDGRVHSAERVGQFPAEPDAWHFIEGGLACDYRLRFLDGGGRPLVVRVRQSFLVDPPLPQRGESGIRREVEVAGAPAGSQLRLRLVGSSLAAVAKLGEAGRSLTFPEQRFRIQLEQPAQASLAEDGVVVAAAAPDAAPVAIELRYVTDVPVDVFPVPPLTPDPPDPLPLDVVPGFESVRLPFTEECMPTGLAWDPSGRLFLTSLKGRVWSARDTDGDQLEDEMVPLVDGLAAPYGIAAYRDYVDVINKYALLRLIDDDRDGQADRALTIASGWGHTADYHDWAVGLPRDEDGHYYVALPCQQDDRSAAAARFRGTVLRLVPRRPTREDPRLYDLEEISGGHRFPMGIARNRDGQLLVTDNQGNYNPFNELNHVRAGAHFGFINKLERQPGFDPPLTAPAIDIPHPWTRSVNGICFLETPAAVHRELGHTLFGPFEGHLLGCEYDTRRLIRMSLERVGETYQGAAYPFSYDEPPQGPPFMGPIVCDVSPRGDLYIAGLRDSGWGGANNVGEVVRMRLRPDQLPAGIAEVRALPRGFVVEFTAPVDPLLAAEPGNYAVSSYTRVSTPAYGGDDQDRRAERVTSVQVSADARRVTLNLPSLRAGYVYEIRAKNLAGGERPFHPAEAHYTMRVVPETVSTTQ